MNKKIFGLIGLGILSLVIIINFASAAVIAKWALTTDGAASNVNTNMNAGNFIGGSGISTITFGSDGAFASLWSNGTLDANDYFQITLSPKTGYQISISDINFGERRLDTGIRDYQVKWSKKSDFTSSTTIETENVPDDTDERTNNITGLSINVGEGETIYIRWFGYNAEGSAGTWRINDGTLNVEGTVIEVTEDEPSEVSACELIGNPGSDLRVKNIDIKNNGMNGESTTEFGDDDAWFPLDDIEVEIEIENNGNDDIDNIEVEWGLWDTQAKEWVIELDNEKDFDLKDDDEETLTISFNLEKELDIDLDELDDGDHYRFYVIATGESQEIEDDVCAHDFEDIEIVIESDFVALYDFQFPETVSCGGEVQIIADVWNIGDRDQDDVYVRVFNTELGINEHIDIGDIDAFDKEDLNVIIDIPEDAKEKIYSINFEVYDEDDDVFETDFDDDPAEFHILLEVSGSCGVEKSALVSASLESGGRAGEELVVKAIIVNTGTKSSTYTLTATGYSGWATSVNIEPSTVLINTGESREVLFTFDVKEDVSGEKTFNIEGRSEGELIFTQPVSVSIEKSEGGISGITGGVISGRNNLYLWGIGILNVILVIIIIIVAIRVARK